MKFATILAAIAIVGNATLLQRHHKDPSTGAPIPICNGANTGNCMEASEVVKHAVRRPHKRASPGAPDWAEQEAADKLRAGNKSLAQKHHHHKDPSTGAVIPICNGANTGNCTEADEVVKHKVRRPHKRATEGAPDWADQEAADKMRAGKK